MSAVDAANLSLLSREIIQIHEKSKSVRMGFIMQQLNMHAVGQWNPMILLCV